MEHLVLAHDSEIEAIDVSKAVAPVCSSPFVEGKMEKRILGRNCREFFQEHYRMFWEIHFLHSGHSSLQILVPYYTSSGFSITVFPYDDTSSKHRHDPDLGYFLRSQIPAKPCPPAKVQARTSVKSIEIGQEICRPITGDWHVAECVHFKII